MMHSNERLMATGPRNWKYSRFDEFKESLSKYRGYSENLTIISGGAQGFDIAVAKAAQELSIPFELYFPNEGYVDYYYRGKGHNPQYLGKYETIQELIQDAEEVEYVAGDNLYVTRNNRRIHSNFERNFWMMENSDTAVVGLNSALLVPTSGGTGHAVRALKENNQHIIMSEQFNILYNPHGEED